MPEKRIENITASGKNFMPTFIDTCPLPDVKFNGHCLINKLSDSGKVINLYVSYTLDPWSRDLNTNLTLNNCLFGPGKRTKNADPDKSNYSGYNIGFDSRSKFVLTDGSVGKNVIIFGIDMASSVHIDNKNKVISIDVKIKT